jgi:uncharacterized protein YndB with AHSA1/START domain
METTTDRLTGLRLDVCTTLSVPLPRLWALVTDVTAIGAWSPECLGASWVAGATHAEPGARFEARNRFGTADDHIVLSASGIVTEITPPRVFAWTMVDDDGAVGSCWRYELAPAEGGGTFVRHSFEHGPGMTGMRDDAASDPASVDARLGQLARHMSATLTAMESHIRHEVA